MGGVELGGCSNLVRWLFIFFNIPILLVGLASLGVGIWQVIVESALEEVLSEDYTSGGALFIACGGLLIGVSFVGCLGAFFKLRPILLVYIAVIFLVIVLEIAAVGFVVAKADDIDEEQIESDLTSALQRYYPSNDTEFDEDLNDVVDFIQDTLECCGINSTEDWYEFSPYTIQLMRLPASCCGREDDEACEDDEAFEDNCRDAFHDFIQENLLIIYVIAIVFAVFELSLLVMSFILFMAINNAVVLNK